MEVGRKQLSEQAACAWVCREVSGELGNASLLQVLSGSYLGPVAAG